MAKMLICDDEPGLRSVIKRYAMSEGYETTEAGNGLEAVEACKKETFGVIIMDIMMPEMDGFTAVKEIRKTSNIPVIMLSARGDEYDRILGFELGVDDYVVKPFSSKEIMLRIAAILRRTGGSAPDDNSRSFYRKDGFIVDMTAYTVFVDGENVEVAPKVFELLCFMIQHKNIAIPREKILSEVWSYNYYGDDRTLDTHMKLLRRAMGPYADLIKTIRGFGYRFEG